MQRWENESSSGSATYETILNDDGKLLCNCRGWTMKRANKPRHCKHTKTVHRLLGGTLTERGEFVYLTGAADAPDPLPSVAAATRPPKGYVQPMMAHPLNDGRTIDDFGSDWTMEEKFDGHRVIVEVDSGMVRAWSRPRPGTKIGLVRQLPKQITDALFSAGNGIYDAELIVASGGGSWDVATIAKGSEQRLMMFDMLEVLGTPVRDATYIERRGFLESALVKVDTQYVRFTETFEVSRSVLDAIWARDGEGVMLKRKASTYQPGKRSDDWLKIKQQHSLAGELVDFKAGKSGPHSVLVIQDSALRRYTVKSPPWFTVQNDADPAINMGKMISINYQQRMKSGALRHATFDHVLEEQEKPNR